MTREKAIRILNMIQLPQCGDEEITEDERYIALDMAIQALENHDTFMKYAYSQGKQDALSKEPISLNDINNALEASFRNGVRSAKAEQEPCDDAVSREWLIRKATERFYTTNWFNHILAMIEEAPSVTQKSGKCKNCKYFEYDSVAKVDGVPLIVAHEICNKWGDGCKTSEDGYCYLFEPKESEE